MTPATLTATLRLGPSPCEPPAPSSSRTCTRTTAALASGSYLATSGVNTSETFNEAGRHSGWYSLSPEQVAGFFAGLELVDPVVVALPRWGPRPPYPRQEDIIQRVAAN